MKKNRWLQGLTLAVCLVMVVSMLPLDALALDRVSVETIEVGNLNIPFAGQYAQPVDLAALTMGSSMYLIDGTGEGLDVRTEWKDGSGTPINNDRYAFEAGKTYQLSMDFQVSNSAQYQFTSGTTATIEGLSDRDYSVRIDKQTAYGLTATFSFKVPGAREYPDITRIVLMDVAEPEAGIKPNNSVNMLYDNYLIGNTSWSGEWNNGAFIGGNDYRFHVELIANPGYSFASGTDLSVTLDGREPASIAYSTSGSLNVLELVFDYQTLTKREIGTLRVNSFSIIPQAGQVAVTPKLSDVNVSATAQFQIKDNLSPWKLSTGASLSSGVRFRYGKGYSINLSFALKDPGAYMFTQQPALIISNLSNRPYEAKVINRTASTVTFQLTIIAEFPDGTGITESRPADCYCYDDLRGALSSESIRYVRLHNVDIDYGGNMDLPPKGNYNHYGIITYGTKILELAGEATFGYPSFSYTSGYCKPSGLIYNTGNLTITGNGKLVYDSPMSDGHNAVIVNRGKLTVESGTIEGYDSSISFKDLQGNRVPNTNFGCAIYQTNTGSTASLTINGGTLRTFRYVEGAVGQAAVFIEGGSATINGGTFTYDVLHGITDKECDALSINGSTARVTINGGSFKGMRFPGMVSLSKYIPSDCRIDHNGSRISNTLQTSALSGSVEIRRTVTRLDVHINAPAAGEIPKNEIYVTQGEAHLYNGASSVSWYDRTAGRAMTGDDTFQAQHIYAVTLRLEAGAHTEFMTNGSDIPTTPTTLNYNTVTPKKVSGVSGRQVMEFTYVFGKCPAVIDHLDITILPPSHGRTPTTTAECGSDIYGLYPTEPISWYDVTLDRGMKTGETFVKGHHYRVSIWVKADSAYQFKTDKNLDPAITVNVNSCPALVYRAYEQAADEVVDVSYDFGICGEDTIDFVNIFNLAPPQPGAKPDRTADVQEPGKYELAQVQWSGPNGTMGENDTFQPGKTYTATLQVVAVKLGGYALYPFANDLQGYINAEQLPADDINVSSGRVYLTKSWICPNNDDPGLIGDVTGDGKVNMGDVSRLFAHVRNKNTITDTAALTRGDATRDGKVNMGDVSRIFAHVRGKNKLF